MSSLGRLSMVGLLVGTFLLTGAGCSDQQAGTQPGGGAGGHAGGGGHGGGTGGHPATGGKGGASAGAGGGSAGAGGGGAGAGGGSAGTGGGSAGAGGGSAGAGGSSGAGGGAGGNAGSGGSGGAGGKAGVGGTGAGATGGNAGAGGGSAGASGADGGVDAGATSCPSPDGGSSPDGGPLSAPDVVNFVANVTVSTLAGGSTTADLANPVGVAIEPAGSLVVSDFDNNDLVRVSTQGAVTTLTSQPGFSRPYALAYDATRNVLYAETDANLSGTHNFSTATIWTINRGSGAASNVASNVGTARGIAVLSDGRLVMADYGNHVVRLLDPATGKVSVLAGNTGCIGSVNGTGAGASFNGPYGIAVLPNDDVVVTDWIARVLRRVTLAGVVTTFAGDGGPPGTIDGPAATARFNRPRGLAADGQGNVYVSDDLAFRIRRIGTDGTVSTLAGDGVQGYLDGAGNAAEFFGQEGIAASADGSTIYVADGTGGSDTPVPYHRVRVITVGP